jgi:hypothetical protein
MLSGQMQLLYIGAILLLSVCAVSAAFRPTKGEVFSAAFEDNTWTVRKGNNGLASATYDVPFAPISVNEISTLLHAFLLITLFCFIYLLNFNFGDVGNQNIVNS